MWNFCLPRKQRTSSSLFSPFACSLRSPFCSFTARSADGVLAARSSAKLFDVLRFGTSYLLSRRFFPPVEAGKLLTYFIFRADVSQPCSHRRGINQALVLRATARVTLFWFIAALLAASISSGYSLFSRTRCSRFLSGPPGSREMILYLLVGGS